MAGTTELDEVYSAIEEAAGLLDVPCSRDKVLPIMTAYGNVLTKAVIAFRVATGASNAGELDCRFTILPKDIDPYAVAVSSGLITKTDHPVDSLLADIDAGFPVSCYGIDFGVVGGFKKTWSFFSPDNMQRLAELAEIPSMPRSLGENLDFFRRHGLDDKGGMIGIDYPHRTVNLYFGNPPARCFQRETIVSMHEEMGLPEPTEEMLALGEQAFGIYVTLRWDSPKIERITFAVMTQDPAALGVTLDPTIKKFIDSAPYSASAAERRYVYAVASSPTGEYNKLQSYYQWRPRMLSLMPGAE
ncbi:MAG: prenyltransferase [Actinomycetota bacterium]|nr:prenyltransferase [Actinomycetota bacterium]